MSPTPKSTTPIQWTPPPKASWRWVHWLIPLVLFTFFTLTAFLFHQYSSLSEMEFAPLEMQFVEPPAPLPPPPPPAEPPPPPKPIRAETPRKEEMPEAKPVFGIQPDNLTTESDMAVATGNTLLKPADSLVSKAPLALPSGPIQLDQMPTFIKAVEPEYPSWAEEQGVTISFTVLVTVDTMGLVQEAQIQNRGKKIHKDFERNAIKAIKSSRFVPYIKNGRKQSVQFSFPIEYRLE